MMTGIQFQFQKPKVATVAPGRQIKQRSQSGCQQVNRLRWELGYKCNSCELHSRCAGCAPEGGASTVQHARPRTVHGVNTPLRAHFTSG